MDAEIRCAVAEAEARESVTQEMEERMKLMEKMYSERLRQEVSLRPASACVAFKT